MSVATPDLASLSPQKRALFESLMRRRRAADEARPESVEPEWQSAGWLDATTRRLDSMLERLGRRRIAAPETIRDSHDACVLKLRVVKARGAGSDSDGGSGGRDSEETFFYKALPPALEPEIRIAERLATLFPGRSPAVLASEPGGYLMAALPGRPLPESREPEEWYRAAAAYAELQVESIDRLDALRDAGCADRGLDALLGRLDALLRRRDDPSLAGLRIFDGLAAQRPRLERLTSRLASLGLPSTFDHGDLHPQNIHVDGAGVYFFDFAESAVAHPFFASWAFLTYAEASFVDGDAVDLGLDLDLDLDRVRLRAALLGPWLERFEGQRSELERIFEQAQPLATLHHLLNLAQTLDRPRSPSGRGRALYRLTQLEAFLRTGANSSEEAASSEEALFSEERLSESKRERLKELLRRRAAGKAAKDVSTSEELAEESARLVPWEEDGWLETIRGELESSLEALGKNAGSAATIARLHASQDSCVLHVALEKASDSAASDSPSRSLYVKAVPPYFEGEITLARRLSEAFPNATPKVVATGAGWYLMEEMAGRPLSEARHVATWTRALRDFARLQIAVAETPDAWLEAGCRDRRLERFPARVDAILAECRAGQFPGGQCPGGRFPGARWGDRLAARRPEIAAAIERLASFGLPETLEHGDFHPHNIYAVDREGSESFSEDAAPTIFFDFSDASISHPLLSPLVLLGFLGHSHPHLAPRTDAFRDAYLEPWTAHFTRAHLLAAFEAARPVASLAYLLNVGECLVNRPRPAPEESVDMRQAMELCAAALESQLKPAPTDSRPEKKS